MVLISKSALYFFDHVNTLFIAIKGKHHNGHEYIDKLFKNGIKNFIIEKQHFDFLEKYKSANFILVKDSLQALQDISSYYRQNVAIPIIGITGSNGKTMVKEWLNYVLQDSFLIARSPKSFNSQVGVPLSIWQLKDNTELGIFEAGISVPGEMKKLEKIIKPTFGLLTNIGPPHQENFNSLQQKLDEKLHLFKNCKKIFYCKDHQLIHNTIDNNPRYSDKKLFT